ESAARGPRRAGPRPRLLRSDLEEPAEHIARSGDAPGRGAAPPTRSGARRLRESRDRTARREPMKPSITEKAQTTRARIRDAALAAFQTEGFEGATMREIARRAGVATGAAYYYFPSKESLVMEFYGRLQARMAEQARGALADKTELGSRVAAVIDANFE